MTKAEATEALVAIINRIDRGNSNSQYYFKSLAEVSDNLPGKLLPSSEEPIDVNELSELVRELCLIIHVAIEEPPK